MFLKYLILLSASFFSFSCLAGEIYESVPESINKNEKYVFYTHGKVLEGSTSDKPMNPNKPEWGIYDFPAVKKTLSDQSYNLIAYHRGKNTNPTEYAKNLKNDVNKLISAGVPASNITLVGFSRGGEITILASNEIKNKKVNFVLLAACTNSIQNTPDVRLYGRILSIYERSDEIGPCSKIASRSTADIVFDEVEISTNLKHGAFFRPNDQWILPVKSWINKKQL